MEISNQHIVDFELFEVAGRLDTSNADELDKVVMESLDNNCESFLFDLSNLEYISSYGIRIFVKLLRKQARVSLLIESESVYSIFKMTGLEERLNIKTELKEAIKALHI